LNTKVRIILLSAVGKITDAVVRKITDALVRKITDALVRKITEPAYLFRTVPLRRQINLLMMDTTNNKQEEIRLRAQNLIIRTERLVEQLDNWMSSDEANKNMIKEIMERGKKREQRIGKEKTTIL
jgi:hypothetical protein